MSRACSMRGDYEICIQILIGELEGKRPLGRPRHRFGRIIVRVDLR
jgi:hypothetical protein